MDNMDKPIFNLNEAAEYSGLKKSYLYKLVHKKEIPHYKSKGGKLTFFKRDELEAWMLGNRVSTSAEIEANATVRVVTGKR